MKQLQGDYSCIVTGFYNPVVKYRVNYYTLWSKRILNGGIMPRIFDNIEQS